MRPFAYVCDSPDLVDGASTGDSTPAPPKFSIDIEAAAKTGDLFFPPGMKSILEKVIAEAKDLGFQKCLIDADGDADFEGFFIRTDAIAQNHQELRAIVGNIYADRARNSYLIKRVGSSNIVEIDRESPEILEALNGLDIKFDRIHHEVKQRKNAVVGKALVMCLGVLPA
jgi:hypothetical protein